MALVRLLIFATLMWGNSAFADLPDASSISRQEVETISSWVAHLNYFYPDLGVSLRADINNAGARGQLFSDLDALEKHMHGDITLPLGSLKSIACGAVCGGGGDDGKCHTCSINGN